MHIKTLSLEGLKLIEPRVISDDRGFFLETYRQPRYRDFGIECGFVQDNFSYSKKGTIRGMHFQTVPGQDKLVYVSSGKIFDVAVDMRPESPSFGKYEAVILDAEKLQQFFIPKGFAHGFCILSNTACVHYKCSAIYNSETEKGFRWNDPEIGIEWPVSDPILSVRDQSAPFFRELFQQAGR